MLLIGMILGFSFGVATIALMIAARRGDELLQKPDTDITRATPKMTEQIKPGSDTPIIWTNIES